jgi:hypothetical protein
MPTNGFSWSLYYVIIFVTTLQSTTFCAAVDGPLLCLAFGVINTAIYIQCQNLANQIVQSLFRNSI